MFEDIAHHVATPTIKYRDLFLWLQTRHPWRLGLHPAIQSPKNKSLYLIVGVAALCMLLASCSHVKKDGPPNFRVDVSRIPNAKPKPEPLSKLGNRPSYVVFGKRYYTLKSSENYEAIGRASWYGSKFHQLNTSSGERYDMLAMTAAHKTLPLPTYVEVTNLTNHKKIIVKVNDRGPFVGNRLIDLSYVAAKKLGINGTGLVKVKAINPGNDRVSQPTLFATRSNASTLYLQLGAFRNINNARKLQRTLSPLLKDNIFITHRYTLYKVNAGPFVSETHLRNVMTLLKQRGVKAVTNRI